MAKLSLHDKAHEGFICATQMAHYADRLAYDARDFGWETAAKLAKEMKETAQSFMSKLRG